MQLVEMTMLDTFPNPAAVPCTKPTHQNTVSSNNQGRIAAGGVGSIDSLMVWGMNAFMDIVVFFSWCTWWDVIPASNGSDHAVPTCAFVQVPHTLVYTCINESMHTSYKLEICELDAIALATQAQWRLRDVSQDSGEDCAKVWRSHIFSRFFVMPMCRHGLY